MIITNAIKTDVRYNPHSPEPLRMGRALASHLNYCAIAPDGSPLETIAGKDHYDRVEVALRARCTPFFNHLRKLFIHDPKDMDTFLDYMAFKQQYPGSKIRWALVIAGDQGVGKDVAIDACWHTYGSNFINNVSPGDIMGNYNDFLACMLLRISEVADLSESNKWAFNERLKVIIAGHPDRMQINPKYGIKYWLTLYNGTVLTTNHLESGIYIPTGDRRYYVIKCASWRELGLNTEQKAAYFGDLFKWFTTPGPDGMTGYQCIAQYLYWARDVSAFNANICPAATQAKAEIEATSNENPSFFEDAMSTYTSILANDSNCYGTILNPALTTYDDEGRPLLINARILKQLISIDAQTTHNYQLLNLAPSKFSYLLKNAGYERLNNGAAIKWSVKFSDNNGPKVLKETFYYCPEPVFSGISPYKEMKAAEIRAALSRALASDLGAYMAKMTNAIQKLSPQ